MNLKKLGIASGDRLTPAQTKTNKVLWGGAGWVRLGQYESYFNFDTTIGTLVWNRDHLSIQTESGALHDPDIVIIQRLMHDTLPAHIRKARSTGQVVINDIDDWYWGLDVTNKAYLSSHPKTNPRENVNHYKSVLRAGNAIMTSTPYLQNRLINLLGYKNIEVLYNTVDVNRFSVLEHSDTNRPIVGWVGSTAHRSRDLETLNGIIQPLYKEGTIRLQHSGQFPSAPQITDIWKLTSDDILTIPATDHNDYPSLMTMDIGIAPLNDIPFNHAKSDIKLLEYSASGIPWVASDLPSYRTLQELWGLGRIAKKNKAKEWVRHITELCDPEKRRQEGLALREAVKSRDITVGARILNEYLATFI